MANPPSTTQRLGETRTPDGRRLTLEWEDDDFSIQIDGEALMHSAGAASEELLGKLALGRLPPRAAARVLVGGLGLGFTLRSVLEHASGGSMVDVVELLPDVVEWNRTHLAQLNGRALSDPRVRVIVADLFDVLANARSKPYDAIILDVDNGPAPLVQAANLRLYGPRGIQRMAAALTPAGRAVVWSAEPDARFAHRLERAQFLVRPVAAPLHRAAKQCAYTIYIADKMDFDPIC